MKLKNLLPLFLCFLLIPTMVSADMILPLTEIFVFIFPVVISLEFVVLMLYVRLSKMKIKDGKILTAVILANIISTIAGLFFPNGKYYEQNLIFFFSAFFLTLLIEFIVFVYFFRKPKLSILMMAVLANVASYLLLFIILFHSFVPQPYSYSRNIQVVDYFCLANRYAIVMINNIGSGPVNLGAYGVCSGNNPITGTSKTCGDITITRTDGGTMIANLSSTIVPISSSVIFNDTCTTVGAKTCTYRITTSQLIGPNIATVYC